MNGSPLQKLLLQFTKKVEAQPHLFSQATTKFIQEANEVIGTRPKPPIVGWVVPRGTILTSAHPRIAGIEVTDELRNGCILSTMEMLTCSDGMHKDAEIAVRTIIAAAKVRMSKFI